MADMPENSEELSVLKSTINKPIDLSLIHI